MTRRRAGRYDSVCTQTHTKHLNGAYRSLFGKTAVRRLWRLSARGLAIEEFLGQRKYGRQGTAVLSVGRGRVTHLYPKV